ncbi:MAG: hypothetical protein WCF16_03370 [Alphaproteobacteria bacterium]
MLVGIFCGLLVSFSDLPPLMFSTATQGGASRLAQAQRPEPAAPERRGCQIKGNINDEGERIYHVPGGQFYDRTRINQSNGERWFCTEAEARAAGWRRSKQ